MTFRSSVTTQSSGTAALLGNLPAGVVNGDVLLAWLLQDNAAAVITTPGAWTLIGSATHAASTPDGGVARLYSRIASSEPASYTWTSNQTSAATIQIAAWSGRSGVTTVSTATLNTVANATPVAVAITGLTAAAGDDLAWFGNLDQTAGTDTWTWSTVSGFTPREAASNANFISAAIQSQDNFAGGATGTLTSTATRSAGTGATGFSGFVVALPVAGSGVLDILPVDATDVNTILATQNFAGYLGNYTNNSNVFSADVNNDLAAGYIYSPDSDIAAYLNYATSIPWTDYSAYYALEESAGPTSKTLTPSGNIVFSGAVPFIQSKNIVPSGAIVFSGSAPSSRGRLYSPSGSIVYSGAIDLIHSKIIFPSGSIIFSGSAPLTPGGGISSKTLTPSGAIVFSGAVSFIRTKISLVFGGITFSGGSVISRGRNVIPLGSIVFSGASSITRTKINIPSGNIIFSGSAPMTFTSGSGSSGANDNSWKLLGIGY